MPTRGTLLPIILSSILFLGHEKLKPPNNMIQVLEEPSINSVAIFSSHYSLILKYDEKMMLELMAPIANPYPTPGLENQPITSYSQACGRYYELTEPRCSFWSLLISGQQVTINKIGGHRYAAPLLTVLPAAVPNFTSLIAMYSVDVRHSINVKGILKTNFL